MHIIIVRNAVKNVLIMIMKDMSCFVNILLNNYSKSKCEVIVNARLSTTIDKVH